jgi:hypothetical protein
MNEIDADELLGSQCRVAKMISDQKIIKRFFNLYKNFFFRRNLQVRNLNVNLYLTIEDKIGEVRIGDVSEVSFRSPGNQLVQEQNNYGGLNHGE